MGMWKQLLHSLLSLQAPSLSGAGARAHAAEWKQVVHRSYPRLAAPVLCRPTGPLAAFGGRVPARATLRGLVVATDELHREGALLELEVQTASEPIVLIARVEAVETLPAHADSRYDVLLQLCDIDPEDVPRLQALLDRSRPLGQA